MEFDEPEQHFVPDYDEAEEIEENKDANTGGAEPAARRRNRWASFCDICRVRTRHRRKHTISLHLPMQFDSERSAGCENCAQIVVASLTKLADFLGLVSVDSLFWFVLDKNWYLESFQTCTITDNDVQLLDAVSKLLHIHPVKYTLNPPNSPAVLAHWRVISYVLNQFPNWQRCVFRECAVFDFCLSDIDMLTDSHFHLDQLLRRKNCSSFDMTYIDQPDYITLAINNCCFSIPSDATITSVHDKDSRIFFTVGAHPRFADSHHPHLISSLLSVISNPAVVGIGEMGLDYSASSADQQLSQVSLIGHLLDIAIQYNKTIVIHCRDVPGSVEAFDKLLEIFVSVVPKFHRIHFHCFTYGLSQLLQWLSHFPNSCFGITTVLFRNFSTHKVLLSEINPHQVVFESDSPYLGSSSSVIRSIAHQFSVLRQIPLPELLTLVYTTTKRLYQID